MTYEITWHIPHAVLLLSINGDYTVEEAKEVNKKLTAELEKSRDNLHLLINATHMKRPVNFQSIRDTQNYMDHTKLKNIYVVSTDKLVKLSMMVIFHFSRAQVRLLDSVEKADSIVRRQLHM